MSAKVPSSPRVASAASPHSNPTTPTTPSPRKKSVVASKFRELQTAPVLRKASMQPSTPSASSRKTSSAFTALTGDTGDSRRPSAWTAGGGQRFSLAGLMGANRFVKKLRSSLKDKASTVENQQPQQLLENTYRLEPKNPFKPAVVLEMLKETLGQHMEGRTYRPKQATILCRMVTDDIRDKVKKMGFDRHRLVVNVVIGEIKGQGVMACSRCSWDDNRDSFATHTFQNKSLFCTASVFGVYKE